jgi:hypothetical protein
VSQSLAQAQTPVHLGQKEQSGIGSEVATVEGGGKGLLLLLAECRKRERGGRERNRECRKSGL